MKRGFTFIELLVSASIFAGVLAMSFISLASVLKTIRGSEATRAVAVSGSEALSKIELYARNASSVTSRYGANVCSLAGSNTLEFAAKAGLASSGTGSDIYISVPATLKQPFHKIYVFKAFDTGNGQDYTLELSEYQTANLNPLLPNCGYVFRDNQTVLNVNTYLRRVGANNFFTIQRRTPASRAAVGELNFDPASIGEPDIALLLVRFKVVQKDQSTGTVLQSREFQTTITPRNYISTFSQL